MNKGMMFLNRDLEVTAMSIKHLISYYADRAIYVDRKYQRKLVWNLRDKKLLIDSIITGLPLPSILFACEFTGEHMKYDVIDGLQRLDAIISFVLGQFSVNVNGVEYYYDPQYFSRTKEMLKSGEIISHDSYLTEELCDRILEYELPIIEIPGNSTAVDLVFNRLNSTGKVISSHDMRQSRSLCALSNTVRRIATSIREGKALTSDHIPLNEIQSISVGDSELKYGIAYEDSFWGKHGIVTNSNLKNSSDEELILHLIASILLDTSFKRSKKGLDDLYDEQSVIGQKAAVALTKNSRLEKDLTESFLLFDKIFSDTNFSDFLSKKKKLKHKDNCFYVIILALYKLVSEGYSTTEFSKAFNVLSKQDVIFKSIIDQDLVDYEKLYTHVNNVYQCMLPAFRRSCVVVNEATERMIDDYLSLSDMESPVLECKIGLTYFSSGKMNPSVVSDITETAVAFANLSKPMKGVILVGVADSEKDLRAWKQYHPNASSELKLNKWNVVGVDDEILKYYGNTTSYMQSFKDRVKNQPIDDDFKHQILGNTSLVNYKGKSLILIQVDMVGAKLEYDGKIPKRCIESNE